MFDAPLYEDHPPYGGCVAEYKTWCRTTVAHNTVVLNQQNQSPAEGKLLFFDDTDEYVACLVSCGSAYPGFDLRRFLVLTDTFMLDAFWVKKEKSFLGSAVSSWDWLVHSRGKLSSPKELTELEGPLGNASGYQHLTSIKSVVDPQNMFFDFALANKSFLRIHMPNEKGATSTGNGIGDSKSEVVPFVLRRRTTPENLFLTLYDYSGNASAIRNVEILEPADNGSSSKIIKLKLQSDGRSCQIALNAEDEASLKELCGERLIFESALKSP